jgi:hypothetical protein
VRRRRSSQVVGRGALDRSLRYARCSHWDMPNNQRPSASRAAPFFVFMSRGYRHAPCRLVVVRHNGSSRLCYSHRTREGPEP